MWAHLRDLCPCDKAPTPLIIRDGELEITIPQDIANTFNEYFSTVANHYITDSTLDGGQHTLLKNFVNEKLDGVYTIPEITEHAVNKALLALKAGKSTGADTISARLLCVCLSVKYRRPNCWTDHDQIWHAYADRPGNGSYQILAP